jgi:hypothetical protein
MISWLLLFRTRFVPFKLLKSKSLSISETWEKKWMNYIWVLITFVNFNIHLRLIDCFKLIGLILRLVINNLFVGLGFGELFIIDGELHLNRPIADDGDNGDWLIIAVFIESLLVRYLLNFDDDEFDEDWSSSYVKLSSS